MILSIFILILLLAVLPVLLIGLILRKTGFSAWWSLLWLAPPLSLIGLWVLAFMVWPVERQLAQEEIGDALRLPAFGTDIPVSSVDTDVSH